MCLAQRYALCGVGDSRATVAISTSPEINLFHLNSQASKQKKTSKGAFDDVLSDLLADDGDPPRRTRTPARALGPGRGGAPPSHGGKRSLLDDDFFSKLAEEAEKDDEVSDVSEADPLALLGSMKDMDDMDADLFGTKKKPSSAPSQAGGRGSGIRGPKNLEESPKPGERLRVSETEDTGTEDRKSSSAPAASARGYRKFSFADDDDINSSDPGRKDTDDPFSGLLDDLPGERKDSDRKAGPSASEAPSTKKEETAPPAGTGSHPKKRDELTFDEDGDELIDALGFDESPRGRGGVLERKTQRDNPQPARTKLDEILGRGTAPRLLERPPTGEKKELQAEKNPTVKEPVLGEDEFMFGSYMPTMASTPEGRQSRRQSVRFSTEDVSGVSPDKKSKPPTPGTPRANKTAADWLGLKQEEEEKVEEPALESLKPPVSPSTSVGNRTPISASRPPSGAKATDTPSASPSSAKTSQPARRPEASAPPEEEDWLAGTLTRKKSPGVVRADNKKTGQQDFLGPGEEVDLDTFLGKRSSSPAVRRGAEESPGPSKEHSSPLPWENPRRQTTPPPPPPPPAAPGREDRPKAERISYFVQHFSTGSPAAPYPASTPSSVPLPAENVQGTGHPPVHWAHPSLLRSGASVSVWCLPQSQHPPLPAQRQVEGNTPAAMPQQVTLSADSLQQLLLQQQLVQSQLWGLGGVALQKQLREGELHPGEQVSEARLIQLEGQVRKLQLERDQAQMLLESVQQRHKQDLELMESTHRCTSDLARSQSRQRDAHLRQENEDLQERLAGLARLGEQERAGLQAQYQQRLAKAQQERDREVERLRELQRKSILEMKKDHEVQVQRLKRLKDEEIDAVTSATSQTRSLTGVIEQMEHFSHRLGELSSRVESTHEHAAQGLEVGARHRDEQLRVLQDRLSQQQRDMAGERARMEEVIARMETRLAEQQRQLEKERWKVTAEQAKAESALRVLEEERRTLTQNITMEREELQRAKSALLEEQQAVMQRCAEERRRLAAEWAELHAKEKLVQERAERDSNRALERDAHREGSIISLAQEQAELKLRAGELKLREEAACRDREAQQRESEELQREKDRLSGAALHLKTRAEQVEAFSKLAAEKYEEGERALQEARQVASEHQARLRGIHQQMERLRQQEQHLHQERMRLTEQRRDLEQLRQGLPVTPLLLPQAPTLPGFAPAFTSTQLLVPREALRPLSLPDTAPELQARLALLRHTAEKDKDFLQDEQFFLETLKKAPYNSAFHTA
nr:PREDICTED: fas-binding factor 1 [Lepisosteus oculatus]